MHNQLYMSKETNLEYGHFIAKKVLYSVTKINE